MAHETPLREEHERHGATLGVWFGALMPERFSDFTQEYGFARETVALADKNYRTFFELTGPDRQRYLNAIVTNDIKSLTPGQGAITLLLNPQGHINAELEVYALEDRLLVVSYAMIREQLFAELDKFIIMDDVTLTDVTDQLAALSLEGPRTTDIVWAICGVDLSALAELSHLEVKVSSIPCRIVRRSPGGIPGAEFMVARGRMLALWQALKAVSVVHGGGPIGYAALRAVSLEDGVPWFGYDFDEQVIPHEAALENIAHQLHERLLHGARDCRTSALAGTGESQARGIGILRQRNTCDGNETVTPRQRSGSGDRRGIFSGARPPDWNGICAARSEYGWHGA